MAAPFATSISDGIPRISSTVPDPDRLAPQDVFYTTATSRKGRERLRSGHRRRKGHYKKLLWFKQPFPDNYTDEETFLDHLQRNPRLQPYQFWSLMADTTVIVQHIASVAIFCCCFVAIAQERVSPVSVVSWASFCTVLGWGLWDYWVGQEEARKAKGTKAANVNENVTVSSPPEPPQGLGLKLSVPEDASGPHSHKGSVSSDASNISGISNPEPVAASENVDPPGYQPSYVDPNSSISPRNQQRLETAKSALLIYAALLGLSPILKSLTRSTTSDSIWALSTWLLCMNVAFFDYGEGTGAQ